MCIRDRGYTESLGRANNSKASFRYWVHQYQEKGSAGLLPSCKNHEYPEDIKRKAVEEYLAGKGSLEQIGGKYGLRSITQLRQWIKVYHAHGDFNSVKFSGGGSYMKQGRDTTQEAVSYTHLDVYKRQHLFFGVSVCEGVSDILRYCLQTLYIGMYLRKRSGCKRKLIL